MANPIVTITRCTDYDRDKVSKSLRRHFELLGGLDKFVSYGDKVLIKPNFIAPKSRRCATQTDPAMVIETARLLKDFGAKPFVGDSPAWGNVAGCLKALKAEEEFKKLGVSVKQLNRGRKCLIGDGQIKVGVSSVALEADKIINMPKFKTHQQLVATFAVKNMFGCVCGKEKAWWHLAKGKTMSDFCRFLIDVYKYLNPVLTIIDGVVAMEGPGPISGNARPLGFIIAGAEPVSCEMVCARLIDAAPEDIPMISAAREIGFGCSDENKIEVLGDDYKEHICKDFQWPKLIPIRFSLMHVLTSITKQILILVKPAKSGQH